MANYNIFSRHESHSNGSLIAYRVFTVLSWLLVHIANIHYAWHGPVGAKNHNIWDQNALFPTGFSLNPTIVDIYWVIILVLQIAYIYHLFAGSHVNAAANVASHFILNNVLMFAFVLLWVHAYFWAAEVFLILNFVNLSSLYFRHSTTPLLIHIPVVSGPLAWNFVAIFWCGAVMVNATGLPSRILANIAVWGFLGYGLFFLAAFKDHTMGFNMTILSAALAVHQLAIKVIQLQWIFSFVIMSLLFLATLIVAIPGLFGKEISFRREVVVSEDQERAPLLNEEV